MKMNVLTSSLLPAAFLFAQPVLADFSTTFNDPCNNCSPYTSSGSPLYYGGDNTGNPEGDVLGQVSSGNLANEEAYDILSMTVSQSGGDLIVGIVTRFAELAGQFTLFGDLLISTTGYSPFGTSPYPFDSITNTGTSWNYVVDTTTGTIYQGADLQTSDEADLAGLNDGIFRPDQYVGYESGGSDVGDATVSIADKILPNVVNGNPDFVGTELTYRLPLSILGLPAVNPAEVALRWTMTCANDIVEAAVNIPGTSVPEPASLALFLSGLAGWRLLGRSGSSGKNLAV